MPWKYTMSKHSGPWEEINRQKFYDAYGVSVGIMPPAFSQGHDKYKSEWIKPEHPHTGQEDCLCDECEPAAMDGPPTLGQVLSGNTGCEWPACSMQANRCRWGDSMCFDISKYPNLDGSDELDG